MFGIFSGASKSAPSGGAPGGGAAFSALQCESPRLGPRLGATGKERGLLSPERMPNDEKEREEELYPFKPHRKNAQVPESQRQMIAFARTGVVWAVLLSVLLLSAKSTTWVFASKVTMSQLRMQVNLCPSEGIPKASFGNLPEVASAIGSRMHKVLIFDPQGAVALETGLKQLSYYDSEEFFARSPVYSIAYSWWLFGRGAMEFKVEVNGTIDCLAKDAAGLGMQGAAQHGFAEAVVGALVQAKRRAPHEWVPTRLKSHGALIIEQGSERMWSFQKDKFDEVYEPSEAFMMYRNVSIAVRVTFAILVAFVLSRAAFSAWSDASEMWLMQYDFLWQNPQNREQRSLSWRFQACNHFLVLDQIVGNPQTNDDEWLTGIGSAFVTGLILASMTVLPFLHAHFFEAARAAALAVTIAHCVSSMAFAACYYTFMSYGTRAFVFFTHIVCSSVCLAYNMWYIVSCLVFILTRLVVAPDESAGLVAAIGSVLVYVIVVASALSGYRRAIIDKFTGKAKKGKIMDTLAKAGLDQKSIIFTVIFGAILILMMGFLLILAVELYTAGRKAHGMDQALAALGTSGTAVFGAVKQLDKQKEQVSKVNDQAVSGIDAIF